MEAKGMPTPARVYQDFEPSMEWVPEDDSDTLLVYLPGFAKEQLRVQLRARNLIISGERKLQQNTWSRFRVEFPVSVNCDLNKISAKFEGNILFVRQPKLITQVAKPEEEKPAAVAAAAPTVQKPADESKVAQKEKPTPTTQPNIENKEVGKDREVVESKLEEKSEKTKGGVRENATDKKPSDSDNKNKKRSDSDNKNKKPRSQVVYGELDKTATTALENYKRAVGVFATKLKTSRNAVNTIVVLLIGLVVGIIVSGSIKSWTKA